MKVVMLTLFSLGFLATLPTLHELRSTFQCAVKQKADAEKFEKLVAQIDTSAVPAFIGYKGVNEMIQAKYVLNPLTKLNKFNKGKSLLQLAVNLDTLNLETRFLRFSIQSNCPGFLNYSGQLMGDKKFLIDQLMDCNDEELKTMIYNYLITSNSLTAIEIKKLKN